MKKLRATCILLSAMLASSNIVWASNYKDTEGHWAESAITAWSDKNVLTGYEDDLFRPDEMITRGEMAVILDKMMDYTEMQENTFTDLKKEDFYTESILKAVKAGTFVTTDDNLARPTDNMTRQEAVVTLAKALGITPVEEGTTNFTDDEQIADWAKGYVLGMSQKGYLNKDFFDKEFRPDESISRAQVATLLDDSIDDLITEDTIASEEDNSSNGKDVIINTPNVKLENSVVDNDLILAEGIGEGDVELNNVTVKGTLIVRGGGIHTVKLQNSKINGLSVEKKSAPVRILTQGSTVETTNVKTSSILEGIFKNVTISSPVNITVRGSIDSVEVAAKANLQTEGTIKNVNVTEAGKDTVVTGSGSVENVQISAENVSVETPNSNVTISDNISSASIGGKIISGGNSSQTSSSGKNGSSSSSSRRPVVSQPTTPSNPSEPEEPTEPERPTPPPVVPTPPVVTPPTEPDKPSQPTGITISSVEYNSAYGSSSVTVTLSQATKTPLTAEDFYIYCNAGNDMTILDAKTTDNKVYTLTTANYFDNTYNLQITIDGKVIQKVFEVKSDCAELSGQKTKRTSDTTAEFQYVSDVSGTLYYTVVAKETTPVLAAYVDANVAVLAESSGEPTIEELIESGRQAEMKGNLNTLKIEGLEKGKSYILYYVAKDSLNRVTPLKQVEISAEVAASPIPGKYAIENVKVNFNAQGGLLEEKYWFTVTFDQDVTEELALENFELTCPQQSDLHLGRVAKIDNATYDVYMMANYIPKDGNTLTMHVTFADKAVAEKDFRFDTRVPEIDRTYDISIKRVKDEDTVNVTIENNSREGYLYYKFYSDDDGYDFDTVNSQDPSDVYANGEKIELKLGTNKLEGIPAVAGQRFCYATENAEGIRQGYLSYCKYTIDTCDIYDPSAPEEPEDPNQIMIQDVKVMYNPDEYDGQFIYAYFTLDAMPYEIVYSDIKFEGYEDKELNSYAMPHGDFQVGKIGIEFINSSTKLQPGNHRIIIPIKEGEKTRNLSFEFVVEDDYQTANAKTSATTTPAAEPAMLSITAPSPSVEVPATDSVDKTVVDETATDDSDKTVVDETTTDNSDKTVVDETTPENSDEVVSDETATDDFDEVVSDETTPENSDEVVSDETTPDDSDEVVSDETTPDDSDEAVADETEKAE